MGKQVVLTILAAPWAEAATDNCPGRLELRRFRQAWVDVLSTFFNA